MAHLTPSGKPSTTSRCANVNFARRSKCNRCGSDRPPSCGGGGGGDGDGGGDGGGGGGGVKDDDDGVGVGPKLKLLGTEIGKAAAEKSKGLFSADDWQCGKCGNVNWARRSTCNICNGPKVGVGWGGVFS